jgi:hypothetical protein
MSSTDSIDSHDRKRALKRLCSSLTPRDIALVAEDLEEVLEPLYKRIRSMEKCDICGDISHDIETDCDSYKDNKVDLCIDCREYCGSCCVYYSKGGAYHHEDCPQSSDDDDDDDDEEEEEEEEENGEPVFGKDKTPTIQTTLDGTLEKFKSK